MMTCICRRYSSGLMQPWPAAEVVLAMKPEIFQRNSAVFFDLNQDGQVSLQETVNFTATHQAEWRLVRQTVPLQQRLHI